VKWEKEEVLVSGVMFQPFEELKGELSLVPPSKSSSTNPRPPSTSRSSE
jgi:hypothetical protein